MFGRHLALVAGIAVVVSQGLQAQQPTFHAETELVNLNVTVVDADQRHVEGLTPEDFEVRENGVPQAVQYFAAGETPLDVFLVLDTSGSMGDSLGFVQQAARRFVEALRPGDRVGVMLIADGLRIVQPLTEDRGTVTRAIVSTRARGQTRLYASIYTALRELERLRRLEPAPRRQAMVVLTDGLDTASALSYDDLQSEVRRYGVPIYTIAPRATRALRYAREVAFGESSSMQDYELRTLAADSGGRAFFPVTLEDLSGIYESIAGELANQYSIGYESSDPPPVGVFRRIALKVFAPGATWRTRTGYIARTDGSVRR
jgi:Ca-activated chloride channel family protein